MKAKPKIGSKDICALMGMTPTAIRLYEKYLIDRRYGLSQAGYRKFDSASLVQFYDMRYLSKCGISVQDAAKTCQTTSLDDKLDAYDEALRGIEDMRDYYEASLCEVSEARSMLGKVDALQNGFEYVERPAQLFLDCEDDGKIADDVETTSLIRQWVELMPVVHFAYRVELEDPVLREWSYHVGLVVPERYSRLVKGSSRRVRRIPAQTCLATTIPDEGSQSTRSEDYRFAKKVLRKGLAFMEEQGHRVSGQIINHLVATNVHPVADLDSDEPCDYYYATFPI